MAYAHARTAGTGIATTAGNKISSLRRAFARYRDYRRTLRALDELDDRILHDLGLSRSELSRAAREAIR
ncbi:MAG: DUF1127 domain-containing protein [Paracoccaceae bacterium]